MKEARKPDSCRKKKKRLGGGGATQECGRRDLSARQGQVSSARTIGCSVVEDREEEGLLELTVNKGEEKKLVSRGGKKGANVQWNLALILGPLGRGHMCGNTYGDREELIKKDRSHLSGTMFPENVR